MTFTELLQLDPQHLAEIASFDSGFEFDHIDIVAVERSNDLFDGFDEEFNNFLKKLRVETCFRGKTHTHALLVSATISEDVFYFVSAAYVGMQIERIIFKISRDI